MFDCCNDTLQEVWLCVHACIHNRARPRPLTSCSGTDYNEMFSIAVGFLRMHVLYVCSCQMFHHFVSKCVTFKD